jgi:6-phosphogluconate dehydrogenase
MNSFVINIVYTIDMKVGLIGLGHMGLSLVQNLTDHGHEVVAWNRSPEKRELARTQTSSQVVDTLEALVQALPAEGGRVLISIISSGEATRNLLFGVDGQSGLVGMLAAGDIVLNMANEHYLLSREFGQTADLKGVKVLDVGISGGVEGARTGACMMVGGDKEAYAKVEDMLKSVAVQDGVGYFGPAGAGHFVKMVHNGIEYGMMQSLAEGVSVIAAKPEYQVEMAELLKVWNHGSIIQSKLVGFLEQAYRQDASLASDSAEIGDKGTGNWFVKESLELGVPTPAISAGLYSRYSSRQQNFIGWRVISAMRRVFGGHSGQDRPIR